MARDLQQKVKRMWYFRFWILPILCGMTMWNGYGSSAEEQVKSTTYYVAVNGNDTWSGTLAEPDAAKADGPFATLDRARDEIRKLKASGPLSKPVNVFVRNGLYQLGQTFKLTQADSGTANAPVTYQAYGKEKPVVIGGKRITGFTPYKGAIMKADVGSQGFKGIYFRELIFNGKRQQLARYPNYDAENPYGGGWMYVDGKPVNMYQDIPGEDKHTLVYQKKDMRNWAHPEEGEVFIFPRYNWWNNIVGIKSVDREKRIITLKGDCSYPIRPLDRYYVRNLLEELDAPGEWYLDKQTWTLYFWPPSPVTEGTVYAPVLQTLVELTGTSYVTIKGLTLECCDGSGIVLHNTANCLIAGNTIRNVVAHWDWGMSGVVVAGGKDNGVAGNDIYEVGGHGISLSGGDRITLTPANNYADNNYIHHTGIYYKQGVGIDMSGCGNRASHNLIHDCPRIGIMFSGNNLIIEYNHIRHINLETEDTGAVYTGGRDWISSRGSVIRYNYFHDSLGYGQDKGRWVSPHFSWGIYLDDNAGGVDVIGNIVIRARNGLLHLHNGRDNLIENNIFIDGAQQQVQYSGWNKTHNFWLKHLPTMIKGYNSIKDQPAWKDMRNISIQPEQAPGFDGLIMSGNTFKRNIVYYTNPRAELFKLSNVPFSRNQWDWNLYWHKNMPLGIPQKNVKKADEWKEWKALGQDAHSVVADPLFINPGNGDYRLRNDSPAFALGFKPIPLDKIGPYKSDLRASWPIVEAKGVREKPLVSEQ